MREVISDPTAGRRARDIRDFPARLRRRVDPTDPRYRRASGAGGRAGPNPDPTDPTYGAEAESGGGHADPTDARAAGRTEMRVLVRLEGRRVGAALPLVIPGRPVGHVHGLARGEGFAEHVNVAGSPVGQIIGGRRDEKPPASRARRACVVRLRGLRSA